MGRTSAPGICAVHELTLGCLFTGRGDSQHTPKLPVGVIDAPDDETVTAAIAVFKAALGEVG